MINLIVIEKKEVLSPAHQYNILTGMYLAILKFASLSDKLFRHLVFTCISTRFMNVFSTILPVYKVAKSRLFCSLCCVCAIFESLSLRYI